MTLNPSGPSTRLSIFAITNFTLRYIAFFIEFDLADPQDLKQLLESDTKFGFLVMDGSQSLFGVLSGNTRTVLHKITVDLPKKHGRGGQSAVRFARLRLEKRHNYLRKVCELMVQFFITNDRPNVSGLILAGLADFKNDLAISDFFDIRLKEIVIKIVDVSYGGNLARLTPQGENGFNQAIELSQEVLASVKFVAEKKLLGAFFDEINQDTGKYCFSMKDTMTALDMGACHTLIVWENLPIQRFVLKNSQTDQEIVKFLTNEQARDQNNFRDSATNVDLEILEVRPLLNTRTAALLWTGLRRTGRSSAPSSSL